MSQKSSKILCILRVLVTLFSALIIMVAGIVATAWQVRVSERQEAMQAASKVVIRTDLLLDEAEQAAILARPYLSNTCSSAVRNELNRLTVRLPHLRVISLLRKDLLICSSFDVSVPLRMDLSQYAGGRLSLKQGSLITLDAPYVVLLNAFPEGTVSVSISMQHLTDALTLLSMHVPLYLRVGNQLLTSQGKLLPVTLPVGENHVYSARYPYSVDYVSPRIPPLLTLSERGKIRYAFFAALSGLVAILAWQLSFRLPSPYDQLAVAVKRQEIMPWYQPVVCSRTGEIYGVEVLARWKHRSGIYIPPDVFIPQAEKSGLIIPLTRQLMARVADDLVPIIGRLRQPFHVAINISAAHIRTGQLTVDDFRRFLSAFPEGSIQLVAEITEREPFTQFTGLEEMLHSLRSHGVQIALDDFGTGYSSLGYLNTLPVDYIKIDRSFVRRLAEGEAADRLLDCVISMARTLGLGLVAEGVESRYQAEWLAAHQVAFLQGYYFSRPLPVSGFIRLAVLQIGRTN